MSEIKKLLKELAGVRKLQAQTDMRLGEVEKEIEDLAEEAGLARKKELILEMRDDFRRAESVVRSRLDTAAYAEYEKTGVKGVSPVVLVCERTTYSFDDVEKIVEWLIKTEHYGLLDIDKTRIKKLLKAGLQIPGASVGSSLYTRVSSDLSDYEYTEDE